MLLGRRSDCGWLAGKLGKLSSFVRAYVCLFSTSRHGSASMFWSSDKRNGSKLGRFWNAVARVFNHCRKSEVEIYFVILQCSGARAFACQGWWAMPHASRRTRPPSSFCGHLSFAVCARGFVSQGLIRLRYENFANELSGPALRP